MKICTQSVGSGPDLVLLHGWGMDAAIWDTHMDALAVDYRVTRIELPGHGRSGFDPQNVSMQGWAKACLQVAPRAAVWVGWSLGGQIAIQAALDEPQAVSALVLVAATPCFVKQKDWPHGVGSQTLEQFSKALNSDAHSALERFFSLQLQGEREARSILRLLRRWLKEQPQFRDDGLAAGLALLQSVDLRHRLTELVPPVLWLFGARDTLVPISLAEAIKALQPKARIETVSGAAHLPFLSHPQRFRDLLSAFIDGVTI